MAGQSTTGPVNPRPITATPVQAATAAPQAIVTNTQPNPKILDEVAKQSRELILEVARIGDTEPYAFGTVACKPLIIAADDSSDTLVLDCLWSVGEVQSVCNAPVSGNSLWAPDIGYLTVTAGASFEHFTGTAGQSASTIMTGLKGSYDALPNKAHSVISMQDGWNLNWLAFVSGVKVADPRLSPITTKIFSENPALILADIFDRSGYTVDWDSVVEAADYADTPTYGVGSPMDPRWAVRGHITTKQSLQFHVHALAQYAGCYVDVRGGTAILVVDKPRSSNHTVTASDKSIVEGTTRLKRRGSKSAPSKVTVNVLAPGGSTWAADYGTSAGPGSESVISMPYWESIHPARMKAKEIQIRAQEEIEYFEFVSRDHSLIRTLGDVGTITYAPAGLSGVTMALTENEPIERGRWRRKYVPYDATHYPSSTSGGSSGSVSGTVNNPYFPPTGPTPVLSFDTVTSESPNYDRIKIDFSPQTWAYLKDYYVTVTTTADTDTILYSEYIAKGSETGSPLTITTYTDFAVDFTGSPENVYQVNVYLRSNVSDGLTDVLGAAGTATIDSPSFETTAKEFGGTSPENYYYLDRDTTSPRNYSGFINSTGSGDTYEKMTLVFCINVQSHADAYFIAGSSYQFFIFCESDGSMVIRLEDFGSNPQVVDLDASASPQAAPWPTGQWRAFKIEINNDSTTSPETRSWKIEAADVGTAGPPETLFNGTPGSTSVRAALNPHNHNGDLWVGHDAWDNDPALNCFASFFYCVEAAGLAWSDFYDSDNKPIDLGATGNNPTGSQPDFYAPDGDLTNNLGFGVNWLESGTVPAAPSSPTD